MKSGDAAAGLGWSVDLVLANATPPSRFFGRARKSRTNARSFRFRSSSRCSKAVPVRYRALVLLATFADMRWGELVGLRRENNQPGGVRDPHQGDACPARQGRSCGADTPKSQAGKRAVAFPAEIAPEIRWHLKRFAEPGERGFVFVGPKGGKLRRSNFHSRSGARPASRSACLLSISTTCGPSGRLSWAVACPAVTVIDPCLLG